MVLVSLDLVLLLVLLSLDGIALLVWERCSMVVIVGVGVVVVEETDHGEAGGYRVRGKCPEEEEEEEEGLPMTATVDRERHGQFS
jgi:hypothetical protein